MPGGRIGQRYQAPFTPREREIAGLLADGLERKEIAARLHLSPLTVDQFCRHLREKTSCRTITGAVAALVRGGVIE